MSGASNPSEFKTTSWSLVAAAAVDGRELNALLKVYWRPICAYVERCGYGADAAEELAQEFVSVVVLERGFIGRADPSRGRFRTFIRAALKNFMIDQHRREQAGTRVRTTAMPKEAMERLEGNGWSEGEAERPASEAFDREWAARVLHATLDRVRAALESDGRGVQWRVFEAAVVRPATSLGAGSPSVAPTHERLAADFGLRDVGQVSSMLQVARRQFQRTLRQVVADTVLDAAEAEDEVRALRVLMGV